LTIEFPYEIQSRTLNKQRHSRSHYPIVPAIIEVPEVDVSSAPFAEKFMIDSGASISIIHQRNKRLFESATPFDTTNIIYGNSKATLDVYNVTLKIQGTPIKIIAALAKDLQFKYSLLGYFRGIETFDIFVMHNKKKVFKLVKI